MNILWKYNYPVNIFDMRLIKERPEINTVCVYSMSRWKVVYIVTYFLVIVV